MSTMWALKHKVADAQSWLRTTGANKVLIGDDIPVLDVLTFNNTKKEAVRVLFVEDCDAQSDRENFGLP